MFIELYNCFTISKISLPFPLGPLFPRFHYCFLWVKGKRILLMHSSRYEQITWNPLTNAAKRVNKTVEKPFYTSVCQADTYISHFARKLAFYLLSHWGAVRLISPSDVDENCLFDVSQWCHRLKLLSITLFTLLSWAAIGDNVLKSMPAMPNWHLTFRLRGNSSGK